MDNAIKISVIIPVYNVEPYIEECLQSVANQTMTEGVECIIIDDCGTDNSVKIVETFLKKYDGILAFSFLHHDRNLGLSAARNTGIKAAKGDYVYFLDSDDTIDTNCIESMYSYIEKYGNIDMVQGSFYENEQEHKAGSHYRLSEFTDDPKIIKNFLLTFAGDVVGAQSRLVSREILFKYNVFFKEGIIHEDNHWTFFLAKHIHSMAFCSKATYFHRYNPCSITGSVNVTKETIAFKTIIKDLCANIDPFMRGRQMELILDTLVYAISQKYYLSEEDKANMIGIFLNKNSTLERLLFMRYTNTRSPILKKRIHNILVRLYKIRD